MDECTSTMESIGACDAPAECEEVARRLVEIAVLCSKCEREEAQEPRPRSDVRHGAAGSDCCLQRAEERVVPHRIAEELALKFDHNSLVPRGGIEPPALGL